MRTSAYELSRWAAGLKFEDPTDDTIRRAVRELDESDHIDRVMDLLVEKWPSCRVGRPTSPRVPQPARGSLGPTVFLLWGPLQPRLLIR